MSRARKLAVVAGMAAAMTAVALAAVVVRSGDRIAASPLPPPTERVKVDGAQLAALPADARMVVRVADEAVPRMDGRVFELSRAGARPAGDLTCKRVAASAAGPGVCLALTGDGVSYRGLIFDRSYAVVGSFPIEGVPDRARVSPDGRYGAYTAFDEGSAVGYFASSADFETDTQIIDLRTGAVALALSEDLAVTRAGRRVTGPDVQFWGVTFAAGGAFYATMATGYAHHLIRGDVKTGRASVIARRIECPALSPDGRRIAYKRRIPYTTRWRLHVRDLRTGRDWALAESRSIDDQPEWLGRDTVIYSDDRSVFSVPADGSGAPSLFARHATSQSFIPR